MAPFYDNTQVEESGKILAMSTTIEARLSALEARLPGETNPLTAAPVPRWELGIALACGLAAVGCALRGLGAPNHPYQLVIGALCLGMAYHSRSWVTPRQSWQWLFIPVNLTLLVMLSKLLIGGGVRHPLFWMQYPVLQLAENSERWLSVIPRGNLAWQPSELATWAVDLTVVQSFLAVATAFTAWLRFQPFASLAGFCLILFSLPALLEFNWSWVFPTLVLTCICLYLQTVPHRRETAK